jgi:ribosomal protein S18 acetylase RimI-like enzyme
VLTSPEGWDVLYGTETQLSEISDVQATSFFEPSALPMLDPFLLESFRGDVSTTLGRKYEYLDSRRFAPLVAVKERDDDFGNRFGTKGLSFSGRWPANASADAGSPEDAAAPIMGVVELSIQRDEDVLARLPLPGDDGAGLSSSETRWSDGLGTSGGDMERWAMRRSQARNMRPRPGRWVGGAPADEYAYVSCMCVKDDYRRMGVADTLMEGAEKVTRQWGYDCACLHVFQKNQAAIKLYTRRGYVVVDDTCPPVDALLGKQRYLMVKSL